MYYLNYEQSYLLDKGEDNAIGLFPWNNDSRIVV
jgi:hypothetical protein